MSVRTGGARGGFSPRVRAEVRAWEAAWEGYVPPALDWRAVRKVLQRIEDSGGRQGGGCCGYNALIIRTLLLPQGNIVGYVQRAPGKRVYTRSGHIVVETPAPDGVPGHAAGAEILVDLLGTITEEEMVLYSGIERNSLSRYYSWKEKPGRRALRMWLEGMEVRVHSPTTYLHVMAEAAIEGIAEHGGAGAREEAKKRLTRMGRLRVWWEQQIREDFARYRGAQEPFIDPKKAELFPWRRRQGK